MTPVTTTDGSQHGTRLLDIRERATRRYPRIITRDEIEDMPRLPFSKGCESAVFISRERDDARFFYQGLCFHEPDMEDYKWMQESWDETYYCMKGVLRVSVADDTGREKVFDIKEGEHFYLPAGYTYTLKASGVPSINFWTLGPAFKVGLKPLKEINIPEAPEYARTLVKMREG
jgi:mannose-6-phosphate isomerase-like protein (cupin superfamily)